MYSGQRSEEIIVWQNKQGFKQDRYLKVQPYYSLVYVVLYADTKLCFGHVQNLSAYASV